MFFDRAGFHTKRRDKSFSKYDYYTFSPTPVCEINVKLDDELCNLLSNAQRLLGIFEGTCRHINGIENVNKLLIKKEAIASCIIDDSGKFSYLDLFIPLKHSADRIVPVLNYIKALDYGIGALNSTQLTSKVIFSTHKILMEHKLDKELVGQVRKKQNTIGDYVVSVSGMQTYNPPEPGELNSYMTDIEKFIGRNDTIDRLIKAALLHYQIEVVHPFESGNGKIGRILILMYLFEMKMLTRTFLPISEFLHSNKVEYFDRIKAVYNLSEYEQWVKFFLKAFIVSADTSLKQIENALQLRNKNLLLIKNSAKSTRDEKYLFDAYEYTEKHIFINISSLSEGIGISYNTASKIIQIFTDLKIIILMKEQERNRSYLYHDFLESMGITV